jgi:hypothetical protein
MEEARLRVAILNHIQRKAKQKTVLLWKEKDFSRPHEFVISRLNPHKVDFIFLSQISIFWVTPPFSVTYFECVFVSCK